MAKTASSYLSKQVKKPEPKDFQKNWARLIQKIYEVDPLICAKCQGSMRIIAFIENEGVARSLVSSTLKICLKS